jgi:hypothetical protein
MALLRPPKVLPRGMLVETFPMLPLFQKIADSLNSSLKKCSRSSLTSTDDHALANYRVELFMSDKTVNINTTLALALNYNVAAETLTLAAEKRIQAELIAFDDAFDHSTTETISGDIVSEAR